MSKGSKRRPQKVADKQLQANWDKIFSNGEKLFNKAMEEPTKILIEGLRQCSKEELSKPIDKWNMFNFGKRKKKEGKK